ncbi:MAG: hypothetical protein ABJO97_22720 [Roseibium sp.]|uniref:hypothetical protein n=1 Tax=Roseibium sp. TaxID=1936156 RepID=UPI0032667E4A
MSDRYEDERDMILAQLNAQKFLLEVLLANFLSAAPSEEVRQNLIARLRNAVRTNNGGQAISAEQADDLLQTTGQMIQAYDRLIDRAEQFRRDAS